MPQERLRLVEFFVDLSNPRPELELLGLIRAWLAEEPPLTLAHLTFAYQPPSDVGEPALLCGVLTVGDSLDLG